MSSENEDDLRGDKVSDLYYSQSPLGQTQAWSQADLDQNSIGRIIGLITLECYLLVIICIKLELQLALSNPFQQ